MPNPEPGTSVIRHGFEWMWIAIAMLGGLARYLDGYLRTGCPPKIGLLAAHVAVSGFSGFMSALTVLHFSPEWALVVAGVGGYMGTQALDWLSVVMRARFGDTTVKPKTPEA